jgi:acetylornithine deacetylase/succinyl-diaminopimelate desuccinylase-like protein
VNRSKRVRALALCGLAVASPAPAPGVTSRQAADAAARASYGALHATPELSLQEVKTAFAARIVTALQTIASRENNPFEPVVVGVGTIHGGNKHNTIPDSVKLQLTVRTYGVETRKRVLGHQAHRRRRSRGCRRSPPTDFEHHRSSSV